MGVANSADKIINVPIYNEKQRLDKLLPQLAELPSVHIGEVRTRFSSIGAVPVYSEHSKRVVRADGGVVGGEAAVGAAGDEKQPQDTAQLLEDTQMEQAYELQRYVGLKAFRSHKLSEQLYEFVVLGLKRGLKKEQVERILNLITAPAEFVWSFIDDEEQKLVFVRLAGTESVKNSVLRQLAKLECKVDGADIKLKFENNTLQLISQLEAQDAGAAEAAVDQAQIDKIVSSGGGGSSGPAEDVLSGDSMDYQIDENELKGLPVESLPQLRKDIKEFRLKVLQLEKNKREKELAEESRRSQQQMRKLFEGFKKDGKDVDFDDEDGEQDEDGDEDDEDDEAVNKKAVEKEKQLMMRRFNDKLRHVLTIQQRNQELIEELNYVESYESRIDKQVKEEYEFGKFKPSNRDKFRELEKDEVDRQESHVEQKLLQESENFLKSISAPIKFSTVGAGGSSEDQDSFEHKLQDVKPQIGKLIEEYLGVEEEELLDYILMILRDNRDKDVLVEELKETFDEDAVQIGDAIWNLVA